AARNLRGRERAGLDDRGVVVREVRGIAGAAEVRVEVVDTRVDDPDLDAVSGLTEIGPRLIATDVRNAGDVVTRHQPVGLDGDHLGKRLQRLQVLQLGA